MAESKDWCGFASTPCVAPVELRQLWGQKPTTARVKQTHDWLFSDSLDRETWKTIPENELQVAHEWVSRHWAYWAARRLNTLLFLAICVGGAVLGWSHAQDTLGMHLLGGFIGLFLAYMVLGDALPVLGDLIWNPLTGGNYAKQVRNALSPVSNWNESLSSRDIDRIAGNAQAHDYLEAIKQQRALVYHDLTIAKQLASLG